jgi:hypothetical protein
VSCARIPDRNLRLALIDSVRSRRASRERWWLAELQADYEALDAEPPWDALDEYMDPLPALEDLIADLPLAPADLAEIRQLTFDGDRDVYACYPDWWHIEPGHYTIHDLRGIEQCTGLEYLHLGQGLVEGASLRPLVGLPNLTELWLCGLCDHRDIASVLELPITRLSIANYRTDAEWVRVVEQLRARGVAIG